MAACYHDLRSKLKSHGGLSSLANTFKKKVAYDEASQVSEDEDVEIGGLFGDDDSEEDFEPIEQK